ncbi:MAG: 50S ribosomal protein L3 [Mycoplasma sp.]|nr:50S ribosomal protein L3 [Mycoplasma sp.]
MKGILGKKIGMTQIYSDHGYSIPVTIIQIEKNIVTKVLTKEKDGYIALQIATGDKKEKHTSKAMINHFKKANSNPKRFIKEIRGMEGFNIGDEIKPSIFKSGELVDVTGISKGKGFAGTIKRWNQHIGPKSHGGGGGSQPIRQTGSLGDISGNKVFKGMTMPGHLGNVQRTVQNLIVVDVNEKDGYILVKGSIPGPNKSFVIIKQAVKQLPNKEEIKLVNFKTEIEKNELLEESKKVGAEINADMSVEEMKEVVEQAQKVKEEEHKAAEAEAAAEIQNAREKEAEAAREAAHAKTEEQNKEGDK